METFMKVFLNFVPKMVEIEIWPPIIFNLFNIDLKYNLAS